MGLTMLLGLTWFIAFILLMTGIWLLNRKTMTWLTYGTFSRRSSVVLNNHRYHMEQVKLQSYRETFVAYQKNIEKAYHYGPIVDMKYDLYDWTITYIQFNDITLGIKLYRPMNVIQLVQSDKPMDIQTMETDEPLSLRD